MVSLMRFWGAKEADFPEDLIPLTLPKRLGEGETVRLLGNAFGVMAAVLVDGVAISRAGPRAGYRLVQSEQQTPSLMLESFVHEREEHRLILNTYCYPKDVRRQLSLVIPGGMTRDGFERFRLAYDCVGATYDWHGHIYGEWRTAGRPNGASPVFIELRQDHFQGEPLVLRVLFHQVASADSSPGPQFMETA
jgi:hypothetical protein